MSSRKYAWIGLSLEEDKTQHNKTKTFIPIILWVDWVGFLLLPLGLTHAATSSWQVGQRMHSVGKAGMAGPLPHTTFQMGFLRVGFSISWQSHDSIARERPSVFKNLAGFCCITFARHRLSSRVQYKDKESRSWDSLGAVTIRNYYKISIITPILPMKNWGLGRIKWLARSHTASKQQDRKFSRVPRLQSLYPGPPPYVEYGCFSYLNPFSTFSS